MKIRNPYRFAVGVALATALILLWVNGAVGVIGTENNDANLMYFGVLAVGIVGAVIARFELSLALFATALAQALVTLVAIIGRLGFPASGPLELLLLNGFFIALWIASACLFRQTARTVAV